MKKKKKFKIKRSKKNFNEFKEEDLSLKEKPALSPITKTEDDAITNEQIILKINCKEINSVGNDYVRLLFKLNENVDVIIFNVLQKLKLYDENFKKYILRSYDDNECFYGTDLLANFDFVKKQYYENIEKNKYEVKLKIVNYLEELSNKVEKEKQKSFEMEKSETIGNIDRDIFQLRILKQNSLNYYGLINFNPRYNKKYSV
jgi:hypothetical protein